MLALRMLDRGSRRVHASVAIWRFESLCPWLLLLELWRIVGVLLLLLLLLEAAEWWILLRRGAVVGGVVKGEYMYLRES